MRKRGRFALATRCPARAPRAPPASAPPCRATGRRSGRCRHPTPLLARAIGLRCEYRIRLRNNPAAAPDWYPRGARPPTSAARESNWLPARLMRATRGLEPAEPKGWASPSTAWGFDRGHTTTPHRNPQLGDYYSAIYNPRVHKTTGVTEMISVAPGDPEMVFGLNK